MIMIFTALKGGILRTFSRNEYYQAHRDEAWIYFKSSFCEMGEIFTLYIPHYVKLIFCKKYRTECEAEKRKEAERKRQNIEFFGPETDYDYMLDMLKFTLNASNKSAAKQGALRFVDQVKAL